MFFFLIFFLKSSSADACSPCDAGTIAIPEMHFTEWDYWPDGFDTFCYGECVDNGWQLYHDSIKASLYAAVDNDLLLTYTVDVGFGASVEFDWKITAATEAKSNFKVTIDGTVVTSKNSKGHGTESFNLSYGLHIIGFWAHGDGKASSTIEISTVSIYGTVCIFFSCFFFFIVWK